MIFLLIIVVIILVSIDLPNLLKNKMYKELIVYSILLTVGTIYSLGLIYDWPLPNPYRLFLKPVGK